MGVVQNYGTPKLPLRRPFANLSRPFAPQQNRDMEYNNVFVCIFRTKDLQQDSVGLYLNFTYRNWMKLETHESVPVTDLMALGKSVFLCGSLTSGHWFCTYCLKNFWSCDVAEWTIAHFGPGLGREDSPFANLSRTFREPFADFSPKNTFLETIFSLQRWLL